MAKPELDFEDYRDVLLDYDFNYFLLMNFSENDYTQEQKDQV